MKKILGLLTALLMAAGPASLLLAPLAALAQSSPGFTNGQVPTAAQWNSYFAGKVDYTLGATNAVPYQAANGKWLPAPLSGDVSSVANAVTVSKIHGVVPGTFYRRDYGSSFTLSGNTLDVANYSNLLCGPGSWTPGHVIAAGTYPCTVDGGAVATTPANPTAQVGNTVVNGTATTFMRSDAAPPLAAGAAAANIGANGLPLADLAQIGGHDSLCNTAGSLGNVVDCSPTQALTALGSGTAPTGSGAVVQAASPALSGTPTAPTASTGDSSTAIATTAFVKNQAYATLASPTFTGTPAAPTATLSDSSTQVATTAFVKGQGYGVPASVLLATLTAAGGGGSATLSDTTHITGTYNAYQIVFENVLPVTNNTDFQIAYSTNGGISYLSTGYVNGFGSKTNYIGILDVIGTAEGASPGEATIQNVATQGGISGSVIFSNPNSTSGGTSISGLIFTNQLNRNVGAVGGSNATTSVINALRFMFTAGNIAPGSVIKILGIS